MAMMRWRAAVLTMFVLATTAHAARGTSKPYPQHPLQPIDLEGGLIKVECLVHFMEVDTSAMGTQKVVSIGGDDDPYEYLTCATEDGNHTYMVQETEMFAGIDDGDLCLLWLKRAPIQHGISSWFHATYVKKQEESASVLRRTRAKFGVTLDTTPGAVKKVKTLMMRLVFADGHPFGGNDTKWVLWDMTRVAKDLSAM